MTNGPLSSALVELLNTANQHAANGNFTQAEALFQLILQAKPNQADVVEAFSEMLVRCGQFERGKALVGKAFAAYPTGNARLQLALATLYLASNDATEAESALRQAVALDNTCVEAHVRLARLVAQRGKFEEAHACYDLALSQSPENLSLRIEVAQVYLQQGELNKAADLLQQTLVSDGTNANALNLLGSVYSMQGRNLEAAVQFRSAIKYDPKYVDAYLNLGSTLLCDSATLGEACETLLAGSKMAPRDSQIQSNLGVAYSLAGQPMLAIQALRSAIALDPNAAAAHSNMLFLMQHMPEFSDAEIFEQHLAFAKQFEAPLRASWRPHSNSRDKNRRLKIGYVSGDFREHAVAFFIEKVLSLHDKSLVEIYCYSSLPTPDKRTAAIRLLSDHWLDCFSLDDDALASRIRTDGIDVLVDLSGHTSGNRLLTFARKPAPLQMSWIGYAGTTGLEAIDYRITDDKLDPPGMTEAFHTETLLRMPHCNAVFAPHQPSPPVTSLPALHSDKFVFGSLNSPKKITENTFSLWAEVLRSVPHAILMFYDASNAAVRDRTVEAFATRGINADRLRFRDWMPIEDFLSALSEIDLALDPFPYNGSTTTFHALWMGVPVVSLAGTRSVSRCGATVLDSVNLDSFVATSEDQYLAIATTWPQKLNQLQDLRFCLRNRLQQIMEKNGLLVTQFVENAYRVAWQAYCENSPDRVKES